MYGVRDLNLLSSAIYIYPNPVLTENIFTKQFPQWRPLMRFIFVKIIHLLTEINVLR
jgi:hypothetical protein